MGILERFNVNIVGNGAPTLVLAHGFGSDQTAWRHQIDAFKDNFRIVLFDYLGCGKSDIQDYSPLKYNSLESYRDDVLAILTALDLQSVVFVGHSVSAMVGALASLDQPDRFAKLIFVGASPRYLNDGDYIGGFEQADLDSLYGAMAASYIDWATGFSSAAMANPDRPELGQEFARSLSSMRPDIAQSTARVIFESDYRAMLPLIQHPVLVLQSLSDIAVPVDVGDFIAEQIPNNHLLILNSHGHFPHLSAPHDVTSAIQTFLSQPTI